MSIRMPVAWMASVEHDEYDVRMEVRMPATRTIANKMR